MLALYAADPQVPDPGHLVRLQCDEWRHDDHEARAQPLDQRHLRLCLGLGAGERAGSEENDAEEKNEPADPRKKFDPQKCFPIDGRPGGTWRWRWRC